MIDLRFYGAIQKVDEEQRMVWGYASTEAVDSAGEVITKSAVEGALDDYMKFANIREMHQLSAVGKAVEAFVDEKGLYIAAKIVDDVAWGKVVSGVYKGFSIGGKVRERDPDNRKIITKVLLSEISLVDRPANPQTTFDVWKASTGAAIRRTIAPAMREIGLLGDPGSGSPVVKMATPRAFAAQYYRLTKLADEVRALPDSPDKAAKLAKVAETVVAVRAQELRAVNGGAR